jgi:cytoskeleton protein RodZ
MTSIGETLRRERTKRGLDLKSVSNELKISLKFLEAIETEAFDKLPGGMFTKSFVRQYSRYLRLDEDDMVTELDRVLEPTPSALPKAAAEIEVPRVEEWQALNDRFSWSSSLPALAMVVVVMLVCSGVYSWWQKSKASASTAAQTAAVTHTAQAHPQALDPAPPQPASPPASHQDIGSADRPAPESAPAVPNSPAPAVTPPAAPGPVHVELTASEPVWVLVQTDGKYSFSGTLEANQTRAVDATAKVVLRIGNAGGVNITLNGKVIGAVGAKGQVKTIQLTSGGWTAAVSKPALPADDIL